MISPIVAISISKGSRTVYVGRDHEIFHWNYEDSHPQNYDYIKKCWICKLLHEGEEEDQKV